MSNEVQYPRPFYKLGHPVTWSGNPTQDNEMIKDGWSPTEIRGLQYPKAMYRPDGGTYLAKNQVEEEAGYSQGHASKPFPPPMEKPKPDPVAQNGRLDALENDVYALRETIAELRAQIEQLASPKQKKAS